MRVIRQVIGATTLNPALLTAAASIQYQDLAQVTQDQPIALAAEHHETTKAMTSLGTHVRFSTPALRSSNRGLQS